MKVDKKTLRRAEAYAALTGQDGYYDMNSAIMFAKVLLKLHAELQRRDAPTKGRSNRTKLQRSDTSTKRSPMKASSSSRSTRR